MAKFKSVPQCVNSRNMTRPAFFPDLEKVKTMRSFWEMKLELEKTTSNKASKRNQDITPVCEPTPPQPSHRTKLHGPKHFLAARKCGTFQKDHKGKDGAEKPCLSPKGLKAQMKMKPPDTSDVSLKKQAVLLEEVQKLNRENSEKSAHQPTNVYLNLEAGVPAQEQQGDGVEEFVVASQQEADGAEEDGDKVPDGDVAEEELTLDVEDVEEEVHQVEEEESTTEDATESSELPENQTEQTNASDSGNCEVASPSSEADLDQIVELGIAEELVVVEEAKKVQADKEEEEKTEVKEEDEQESEDWAVFRADGVEFQFDLKERLEREKKETKAKNEGQKENEYIQQYYIDTTPPPAAPFNHRIVSAKPNQISNFYTINWQEVLGGGRFGQVHKCVENSSGLTLAAKVIKARAQKEKEVVKNEIQVMNNLDHANLIQLYAAYESRNDIILVLEYVGGGELFNRIIDENYTLMELDAVVFIRQICEGLQHMHKMYILHLDLKPENILCVSRVTNKIKIIDFGLARIYKPREKLRVNFGTPEFLAPEVINYDFVSFNTDMWSLGVITYMLLSGLCPFLGDNDNETLNNILACQWNLEEQEFVDTSEEAKDFISRLLVVNKSWRMGASEALRHPWLSNPVLHHKLHTKKTMCRSRRSSCVPPTDS
ncbi:myosin light chain kinase family member 4-like isoform X2 [Dunckerocampus dactyliophorus]|uniref:myosin light chain kinase family member 4-like isoform X2 n=1 Tax=Dunckerocampus dactyliophorus TaxID=161453 RepID=UPI0024073BF1|nr:myosin light chain kinase family member 4-like isoform X2 [Dunckerocampus dactyliophorus]XP_054623336.1 myosin light chain kinase family member 4-like isoform X2 [Dunckerocampus dactyliophorus]